MKQNRDQLPNFYFQVEFNGVIHELEVICFYERESELLVARISTGELNLINGCHAETEEQLKKEIIETGKPFLRAVLEEFGPEALAKFALHKPNKPDDRSPQNPPEDDHPTLHRP